MAVLKISIFLRYSCIADNVCKQFKVTRACSYVLCWLRDCIYGRSPASKKPTDFFSLLNYTISSKIYSHWTTSQHETFLFKWSHTACAETSKNCNYAPHVSDTTVESHQQLILIGVHWFLPLPTYIWSQMCLFAWTPCAYATFILRQNISKSLHTIFKSSLIKANEPVTFFF